MTNDNWSDNDLSTEDRKFYARERITELVYVTKHPRRVAIDPLRLRKAARAARRRRTVQLAVAYLVVGLCGAVIVAAVLAAIWALCVLAWAGFGS